MKCQNPNCSNETNASHSKFCRKCSLRWNAKQMGYTMQEEEIELEDGTIAYLLKRSDLK